MYLCGIYAKNSEAYRLLDVNSNIIVESRDVEFFEDRFYHDPSPSSTLYHTQEPMVDTNPSSSSSRKRKELEVGLLNLGKAKELGKKRII